MLADVARDARYALRSLAARPAYSLVIFVTIALVVGVGSAVLAVVNATLVRPLPFVDGSRLIRLYTLPPGLTAVQDRNPLASLDLVRFRARLQQVEGLAGEWARERALDGQGDPESVPAAAVSASLFPVLGATPALGRTFTEDEDLAGAKVVVLSDALWRRRFGADPTALGRHVTIDREPYEIIGVMPPGFNAAYVASELWTPLGIREGNLPLPNATFIQTVARLRPGATLAQVNAELAAVMKDIGKEAPAARGGWTASAASLRDFQFGATRPALLTLIVAIVALALIACANLVNLTVAEIAGRRSELVLRAALGAGRADLLRLHAVEAAIMALTGGAAGLVLALWALPAVLALDPATARLLGDVSIDWRVQAAGLSLAVLIGIVTSVLPIVMATSGDLAARLAGDRRSTGGRRQRRVRFALVAGETLLAVLLLTCGAMLLSAFSELSRHDPGFDAHGVLGAQVRLSTVAYPTAEARTAFVKAMLERLRAAPGVTDASTTANLFVPGFAFVTLIGIDGHPSADGQPYTVQFRRVSPGYFRTMRIPELEGRTFDDRDTAGAMLAAVVSRSFADRYWPGEDPVGRRVVRTGDPAHMLTVIGVVGDVSDVGFGQPPAPTLYTAYAQGSVATAPVSLVVRAAGDPAGIARSVARAIREVDPAQPLSSVTTLDEFLDESLGPDRFRSVLLVVLAALGLTLAAVGIYGVTSRGVAERTREIGVRLALGCAPAGAWRLLMGRSLGAVAVGFAGGLGAAGLAAPALRSWLPGLDSARPLAIVPALVVLAIVGLVSAALPARRAMRVDPIAALSEK